MADVKPLKLEFDSDGTPSGLGEFKTGDTIETAIVNLSMGGLTDVSSTLTPLSGNVLVYDGNIWSASSNLFLWFRSSADGVAAISQYFGSGTGALTVNHSGFPSASSTVHTNGYVEIPYTGVYEIFAKIGGNVTTSPTTVSIIIMTTTGWGGTETTLALGTQVIRTNIDPHQCVCDYIGHLTAGTKIAIKFMADGTNTVKPERFASVSFKKIG